MGEQLLQVEGLTKHFVRHSGGWRARRQVVQAVSSVSFSVSAGETVGLVGESGCGKSTTALLLVRLLRPDAGRIVFDGADISHLSRRELLPFRRRIQMVFQDPFSSLDPKRTLAQTLTQPLVVHGIGAGRAERRERVRELLQMVGLSPDWGERYPHQLSGGQRQRVGIARALAVQPDLVIADEAVSALDVSVRAQILNLFADLKERYGHTNLFISHDLGVIYHICDRVVVMYLGRVVEVAPTHDLFTTPRHPYTEALIGSIPVPDPDTRRQRAVLEGDVPSPIDPPPGCPFQTRCPRRVPVCAEAMPELRAAGAKGHLVACHVD